MSSLRALLSRLSAGVIAALLFSAPLPGADARPVVGPGASKEEVIAAYGWPNGQSQAGDREILTYSQGRIVLVNGRVEQVFFSPTAKWAPPRPKPAAPTATTVKAPAPVPSVPVDYWTEDYDEAIREAKARHARVLALFTGSDWSPMSKRFRDDVELNPDFVQAVLGDFVLLRLDYPAHKIQTDAVRDLNARLREKFRVTTYPSLLVLSSGGVQVANVDLAKLNPSGNYREQVVAAISEVSKLLSAPRAAGPGVPPPEEESSLPTRVPEIIQAFPQWMLPTALVLLVVLFWRLQRKSAAQDAAAEEPAVVRHLPSPAEMAAWTQPRLRDICAAVFEVAGYRVKLRPAESGAELALFRGGEAAKPEVLVHCQSGAVGLVGARTVREVFGTAVAEGVGTAWVVSPGGFTAEARQAAAEHGVLLIDGEHLLQRLGEVPPLALMRILAKSV